MSKLEKYLEKYEPVIGLEVHAQLNTSTKLFCNCANEFGSTPNTNVCPVCLGHPGVLPVLNHEAVTLAIKAALALNLTVHEDSRFARKNYFYPDLPKGYQISQFDRPIATGGYLMVPDDEKEPSKAQTRIGITRLHMEEDAGKLVHATEAIDESSNSAVDYNRAGVPLVEIVSEPDIRSFVQAGAYMRQLRSILRYTGVCDGDMEKGSLRCDANVSVRRRGETKFGTRTETKNVNSFRFVEKAIEYEFLRQCEVLEFGGKVTQETRLWDGVKGVTRPLRSKEEASDYRYFPEPDLPPLVVERDRIEKLRVTVPELPVARAIRFNVELSLPHYDAGVLTSEREIADYFEAALSALSAAENKGDAAKHEQAKAISNWMMTELFALLKNDGDRAITASPVSSVALAALVGFVRGGKISGKQGKEVVAEMYATGKAPEAIIKERGLEVVSDTGAIEAAARKAVASSPENVALYKGGKDKLVGWFVGQVMKEMAGKADPKTANEIVKRVLDEA